MSTNPTESIPETPEASGGRRKKYNKKNLSDEDEIIYETYLDQMMRRYLVEKSQTSNQLPKKWVVTLLVQVGFLLVVASC